MSIKAIARMAKIKKIDNDKCCQECGEIGTLRALLVGK
jgi:hypothetical protein